MRRSRPFIRDFLGRAYLKEDGSENILPIAKFLTEACMKKGFVMENRLQKLDGITVYPYQVLCPEITMEGLPVVTDETKAIHYFSNSWMTPELMQKYIEMMKNRKEGEILV